MAFDQSTRNRLQKFVSNARAILGEEFTRQLQATYGLDPKQGTVATIDSLTHLDNRQRQTAYLLRETLAHYLATTPGSSATTKGEKDRTKQVLDRIVREQAFTVLNRLAALRMAEARGFLLESIAKAHSSKGFQLYRQLSGTAHGETGDAYRNYLFSLFDEFSLDLAVLFDRHSAQGRLFPRETALLELLAEINHHEIEHLWAEDETIGWIYQYFNSQEERKKMRAESQAPRNSRELAVRNQFFTPRYVVEFLTDNTLGRIWYEMTQGNTALVDSCRYLVRRPTEIFLKPGETAPETEASDNEALSQEELLKQPVYIPYRPLKDPRSIRMLDPACGSMHFGLYAFDLFERIYLEAWQLEQQLGPDAFTREGDLQTLQHTFESLEAFKQQIPKLIIEHNIHGVDIDPRAVQIAGLSLWQRAQRAWHQQGIKPQHRPTIVKSNIVCAEPMPGEKALLQEFTSKLNPPVLGQLLEVIFDKMQLAGEAGTLLRIEEEIQTAIHEAREQWLKQSGSNIVGDLFQVELDAATPQTKLGFDLRGIDDATFWDDTEQRILQALSDYADQAESNADQKRLFAEDAAKGFAFIDLCRKRFDVVLMNPPFGSNATSSKVYIEKNYARSKQDIFCCFVERCLNILITGGISGTISNRTAFFLDSSQNWRELFLGDDTTLTIFADLGDGVLDTAMVETAAYTILNGDNNTAQKSIAIRCVEESNFDKEKVLIEKISSFDYQELDLEAVKNIPGSPIAYWLGNYGIKLFKVNENLNDLGYTCRQGIITADDERFIRLKWEVNHASDGWSTLVKGGDYAVFYASPNLVVNSRSAFSEIEANANQKYPYLNGNAANMLHLNPLLFESDGIYYTRRTSSEFSCRFLKQGTVFSDKGPAIQIGNLSDYEFNALELLGICNSSPFRALLSAGLGATGAAARSYETGLVSKIPLPKLDQETRVYINESVKKCIIELAKLASMIETNDFYSTPFALMNQELPNKAEEIYKVLKEEVNKKIKYLEEEFKKIDSLVWESYRLNRDNSEKFELAIKEQNFNFAETLGSFEDYCLKVIAFGVRDVFGRVSDVDSNVDFSIEAILSRASIVPVSKDLDKSKDIVNNDTLTLLVKKAVVDALYGEERVFDEFLQKLKIDSLEKYLEKPSGYFSYHLGQYSGSRRKAPIYWPLQTPSGSYTLWVYYHRLNEQILYTCVNDFIEPKLEQVEQDLNGLRSKSARSSQEEKELEKLSDLASELRDFRDELLRLAKFWKPNLNDGVQITAAPLWKLFQHKAWQKKLKETWEKLEKGDYDWAHLACSIWPERVLKKCHQDRSLAIAHDVEAYFWNEVEVPVKRGKKLTGETKLEWQPKDLNEPALLALIKQIKEERGL